LDLIISPWTKGSALPDSNCNTNPKLVEDAEVALAASDTQSDPFVALIWFITN